MPMLDNKSMLQSLREQEMIALQSINKLTGDEMMQIDRWLSNSHNTYEDLEYPNITSCISSNYIF